jgi:hypothetical protein
MLDDLGGDGSLIAAAARDLGDCQESCEGGISVDFDIFHQQVKLNCPERLFLSNYAIGSTLASRHLPNGYT